MHQNHCLNNGDHTQAGDSFNLKIPHELQHNKAPMIIVPPEALNDQSKGRLHAGEIEKGIPVLKEAVEMGNAKTQYYLRYAIAKIY